MSGSYVGKWPRALRLRIQSAPGTPPWDAPNMHVLRAGHGLNTQPCLCVSHLTHLDGRTVQRTLRSKTWRRASDRRYGPLLSALALVRLPWVCRPPSRVTVGHDFATVGRSLAPGPTFVDEELRRYGEVRLFPSSAAVLGTPQETESCTLGCDGKVGSQRGRRGRATGWV